MMEAVLLDQRLLPKRFKYPPELLRLAELELLFFDPWDTMTGESLEVRMSGLADRYPDRNLVPFARREDNDDVACFEILNDRQIVVLIHDFASPGWEGRREFDSFRERFHIAVEEMFDSSELNRVILPRANAGDLLTKFSINGSYFNAPITVVTSTHVRETLHPVRRNQRGVTRADHHPA
ncbi:hypothetical protein [Williamsia sterculiae]|nr:hypothetical protein [Williamsia sterculiae]